MSFHQPIAISLAGWPSTFTFAYYFIKQSSPQNVMSCATSAVLGVSHGLVVVERHIREDCHGRGRGKSPVVPATHSKRFTGRMDLK